jgi:hypothetical protein
MVGSVMNTREKIEKRFKELESELNAVIETVETHISTPVRPRSSRAGGWSLPPAKTEKIDTAKWYSWCTSAAYHLIPTHDHATENFP